MIIVPRRNHRKKSEYARSALSSARSFRALFGPLSLRSLFDPSCSLTDFFREGRPDIVIIAVPVLSFDEVLFPCNGRVSVM